MKSPSELMAECYIKYQGQDVSPNDIRKAFKGLLAKINRLEMKIERRPQNV